MSQNQFVVIWEPDEDSHIHLSLHDEKWVSYAYDMKDCDSMEGIDQIFALDSCNVLVPIRVGVSRRILSDDDDSSLYYARSCIWAGDRLAGYVHYTDH